VKKGSFVILLLILTVFLCGCAAWTVDDMYMPPKRSEAYNNLQTVIDDTMVGLEFCAPLSGDHQQTIQMADLDGDGAREYLLFAKGNADRPLRILIFKHEDEKYVLADTIEHNGSAFEQIEYVQMDGIGGVEVVVGCQINEQVLHAVTVYTFTDGQAERLFSSGYTRFLEVDMDENGTGELFVLRPGQTEAGNGIAELYSVSNGTVERSNEVSMSQPSDNLKRVISGHLYGGKTAVYAASTLGESEIVTDVYTVNDGRLTNVTFSNESGTSMHTIRNYYVYAEDIDNDGVVELPDLISTLQPDADKQDVIRWYAMKANGREVDKLYTYHNFIGGWYLQIESKWAPSLMVWNTGNRYEFGLWNKAKGITEKIFTVYVLSGQNREESIRDDRFVLHKTDTVIYAAALEEYASLHGVTKESLTESFHMIRQDWKTGET